MKKKKKSMADIDKEKQEKWDAELPEVPLYRILALNAREWWLIILGILAALLQGSIFPLFAIFFGNILSAFYQPRDQVLSAVTLPALLFLILAIVAAVIVFVKIVAFAISGEFLTARIRSLSFKAMLRQELGWYDDERNSTGALTTRLAEDAALVQGATGSRLAQLIETLFTMLLALGIALGHSWIMTFVILGFAPFLVIVGVIRALTFKQYLTRNKSSLSEAGKVQEICLFIYCLLFRTLLTRWKTSGLSLL
jgi:ABC-type multidrug transport system fused ATPase/permease subunit